ncbi:flavin reductase family protein [Amycolatopsis rubida]|uniref:Flavin reductase family protein n=1 Tax=Amycolatopsis rubida TaxID=112413 RepID=A0ABX0BN12_9PSEU|nr:MULTISPECIES: flavin reductase family protein [Amycolatopsis]MYW91394.1 flavin reductase family protein [Amycolatopsis rubida]NEC56379.1 flavin reductase family protein [Amycolatopsis rubida]OAP28981.1 Flavin reductase like domain protein [Amycolatopsis sp. M39]
MRKDFDPAQLAPNAFYHLMTATVVPRPIAWVSSISRDGVDNLAPHSFFTVASPAPAVLQFTSVGRKDTLRNVEATRQFVVNLAPEPLFEQINATGADFPPELSEFDEAGLTREPSLKVRPPRVAESPVAFECELHSTVGFGRSTVVFGRVVHLAVAENVLDGDHPLIERLRPLSRLGRDEWGTLGEVKDLARPAYKSSGVL